MNRAVLSALLCLAMTGVSCRILPEAGVDQVGPAMLPPAAVAAVVIPEEAETAPVDADVRGILWHLESRHTGLSRAELPALAELIVSESRRLGLDPALALAVIRVESGCFNYAVSHVGAMGLMQLMPGTGEELAGQLGLDWQGPESLFDARINVQMGIAYLKKLSDRYDGHTETALAAYNWGPGRIDRRLRRGQGVPELYATRVLRTLRMANGNIRTS